MELSAFFDAMVKWGIPIVITGIAAFVVAKIFPPVKAWIEANVDVKQLALIHAIIAQVVETAEASRLKAKLEGTAFDALKFALELADKELLKVGIDIDQAGIALLIRNELYAALKWDLPGDEAGSVSREITAAKKSEPLKTRFWA